MRPGTGDFISMMDNYNPTLHFVPYFYQYKDKWTFKPSV